MHNGFLVCLAFHVLHDLPCSTMVLLCATKDLSLSIYFIFIFNL